MQERANIKFVHYLRAIGCLSVVYAHWVHVFLFYPDVCNDLAFCGVFPREHIPFFVEATRFESFSFGMFGVAIFFLISGFLTSISWRNRTIGQFIIKRVLRLYPLYLVGLLFTGGVLYCSARMNEIEFPYTFDIFLMNFSLFRIWFWVPSIDGVNWTMEVDVFLYLICIACVYFGHKLNDVRLYMALSLFGLLVIYLSHDVSLEWVTTKYFYLYKFFYCINHFLSFLPFIFIGMTLWNAMNEKWTRLKTILYVAVFYMFFSIDYVVLFPDNYMSYWVSYGYAMFLFIVCYYAKEKIELISCRALNYVGDISFPLYIVHGAAGYAVLAWLWKLDFGLWSYIIAGAFLGGIAHLLHEYMEKRIEIVARRLISK